MSDPERVRVHWSFWLVGVLALIWNALGSLNYLLQLSPEMLAMYGEAERLMIETRPAWATAGFAISVFGGVLASLLLLFRRSAAAYLFFLSLIGTVVTMVHSLGLGIDFSAGQLVGIIALPIALPAFLVAYTRAVARIGWTR